MEQKGKLSVVREVSSNVEAIGSESDTNQCGDGGKEVRRQHPEVQTEGEASTPPALKKPIFIGCLEAELVLAIENILFNGNPLSVAPVLDKEQYAFVIMNPEIYQGLYQQYLFTELSGEERQRQNLTRQSAELKQQAFINALQVEERVRYYRVNALNRGDHYKELLEELFTFNQTQLHTILKNTQQLFAGGKKQKLPTNKDTWNMMDLLLIFGYLLPVEGTENLPKEKVQYQLVIGAEQRLELHKRGLATKKQMLEARTAELLQVQERIAELEAEIEASKPAAPTSDEGIALDQQVNKSLYEEHDALLEAGEKDTEED